MTCTCDSFRCTCRPDARRFHPGDDWGGIEAALFANAQPDVSQVPLVVRAIADQLKQAGAPVRVESLLDVALAVRWLILERARLLEVATDAVAGTAPPIMLQLPDDQEARLVTELAGHETERLKLQAGRGVRWLRVALDMSLRQVAERIGLTPVELGEIERGVRPVPETPGPPDFFALAKNKDGGT